MSRYTIFGAFININRLNAAIKIYVANLSIVNVKYLRLYEINCYFNERVSK